MRPTIISTSHARNYYYEKDAIFSKSGNSCWHGKLAEEFGLTGEVKKADFFNLIAGNVQGNQIIQDGRDSKGEAAHRAGIDIAFSAPKSVSIMALHGGDKRLIEAHQQAIATTIDYIENHYVYIRKFIDGHQQARLTGSGLFATFQHSTSREGDVQLHTHTLLLNCSQYDKKFYATWNDAIFRDQKLLNSVFQSELSRNVKQLGYEITVKENGKWELAGISEKWIDIFSKRTKQIDSAEKELTEKITNGSFHQAIIRNKAALVSRKSKDRKITAKELKALWNEQVPRREIKNSVRKHHVRKERKPVTSALEYTRLAYENIHETESVFRKADILNTALQLSRSEYTIEEINKSFRQLLKEKELIYLSEQKQRSGYTEQLFTSRKMMQIEQGVFDRFKSGKNTDEALLSADRIQDHLETYDHFTKGQKDAVKHILSSTDRFLIIQGDAGTGKTSAIKSVHDIMQTENIPYKLRGLGFTGKAAQELEDKSGIQSGTISGFLSGNLRSSLKPELWIVDESSLVGSVQMKELLDRATTRQARVVFIGDGKQLPAISAGKLFSELQNRQAVEIVEMEEVLRQKTDLGQKVVNHIKQYQEGRVDNLNHAFDLLSGHKNIVEIPDKQERITALVNDYVSRSDQHKDTLIVTSANHDRILINEAIRPVLKEAGKIDKTDIPVDIKTPQSISGTGRYFAANYHNGQSAFVSADIEQTNLPRLKAGQEVTIIGKDTIQNSITVADARKNSVTVSLKHHAHKFSLYQTESRHFTRNEKVVFLKNDKQLRVQNGTTGVITAIEKNGDMTVVLDDKQQRQFNIKQYAFIENGYAVSTHRSQGQTAKNVLLFTDSQAPLLNNTQALYVGLSRASHHSKIYTDNISRIKAQFERGQEKTSSLNPVKTIAKSFALER